MVPFVGQKLTWIVAVSPAFMVGVEIEALIPKSTTGTVCVTVVVPMAAPFAPALPETETCDP